MRKNVSKENILRWFAEWGSLKQCIHFIDTIAFPKKKEIWWVNLGQNIGVEANGKNADFERPVLVIKAFNAEALLVVPISSAVHSDKHLFLFTNQLGKQNVLNLSQIRTLSNKRFKRKVGEFDSALFDRVLDKIRNFLS
jgi:mRNA-degrading endonuclease toxin of MazEF toxin-antitoxin module